MLSPPMTKAQPRWGYRQSHICLHAASKEVEAQPWSHVAVLMGQKRWSEEKVSEIGTEEDTRSHSLRRKNEPKYYSSWFVVREKHCSGWKNKLKSMDCKTNEQDQDEKKERRETNTSKGSRMWLGSGRSQDLFRAPSQASWVALINPLSN